MAFMTLNGITIPVFKDSLVESYKDHGDEPVEGAVGVVMATRVAKLRRWSFRTPPLRNDEWRAYVALIEGFGGVWEFTNAVNYSAQGYGAAVASTFTTSAAGGKDAGGGSVSVGAGSNFNAQMRTRMGIQRATGWAPTDGYTMMAWRTFVAGETYAAGYHHCLLTGAVDFVRGTSANPAGVQQYVDGALNNSANLGRCFSISNTSPFCGLHGVKTDNTNNAIVYDSWVLLPFRLPNITSAKGLTEAQWAAAMFTFHSNGLWSNLPRLYVDGEFLEGEATMQVIGRVRNTKQSTGRLVGMGATDNNLRELEVDLYETLDPT